MNADYKDSTFRYIPESKSQHRELEEVIYSADKNEVLAVKRLIETRMAVDSKTTVLAAAILAVTVVLLVLLLATVYLHRKRQLHAKGIINEKPPKGKDEPESSTSFSNPLYVMFTAKLLSAVCRRPVVIPTPPRSPDVATVEAQFDTTVKSEVDDEFENPNYEVIDDKSLSSVTNTNWKP